MGISEWESNHIAIFYRYSDGSITTLPLFYLSSWIIKIKFQVLWHNTIIKSDIISAQKPIRGTSVQAYCDHNDSYCCDLWEEIKKVKLFWGLNQIHMSFAVLWFSGIRLIVNTTYIFSLWFSLNYSSFELDGTNDEKNKLMSCGFFCSGFQKTSHQIHSGVKEKKRKKEREK